MCKLIPTLRLKINDALWPGDRGPDKPITAGKQRQAATAEALELTAGLPPLLRGLSEYPKVEQRSCKAVFDAEYTR